MSLVDELIKPLLEKERKTVAVYGGGFKPPTAGHFKVVDQALKENPNIDEFIILIGGKERDGVSPEESLIIWDIYKQYLPIKVEVKLSPKPPIQAVYNYAKEHPDEEVLFVIGAREGNEDDFSDIAKRTKGLDKYDNLELRTIVTQGGASGTAARSAAKISTEKLRPLLPKELKDEEVEEIFNILSDVVKENDPEDGKAAPYGSGYKKLNENASYKEDIDIQDKIDRLTQHMISKGMNIEPLPSLEFVDGDSENAKDFFGRTAYYDPNKQHIVLYTEGRHPKDIVRSYAHEMIHHIQNLEDRLGDIAGTDTTSDEHLDKLEQEANLKGTMTFRNWTDSLNEDIEKINYTKPNFKDEWEEAIRYSEFKEMGLKSWIEIANKGYITNYSKIKDKLGNVDLKFDSLEEPKKQRFQDALNKGNIEMSIAVKFSDDDYDLVAGNTRISGLVKNKIDPKIWVVDLSNNLNENLNEGPQFGVLYHFTQYLSDVLDDNILRGPISLTRSLDSYAAEWLGDQPYFILDKDKLRTKYKIRPFKDTSDNPDYEEISQYDEMEEVIDTDIINLSKYIIKVVLPYSDEEWEDVLKEKGIPYEIGKPLNEAIVGDKIECDNCDWSWDIVSGGDDLFVCHKCGHDNEFKTSMPVGEKKNKDPFGINAYARELAMGLEEKIDLENAPEKSVDLKTYGDLKLALTNIKKDQNLKKFKDVGGKAFSAAIGLIPGVGLANDAYGVFKAAFNKPDNVKTNTWLDKLDVDDDASKIVDDTVENEFLKAAADKFMKEPDDKVLDSNFNMDDELNNHLKKKFNARHVGGVNEQEKIDYKIYCDMDGVLVDFEGGYEKLTGIDLKGEFKKGDDFWDPIKVAGVGFWAGLKWMPDGQKLWDYIKPLKPEILSAPSREESSRIGKAVWVKYKLPGTKLILRYAKQKQQLATPESILIDDRQINIDQWEAAGGIGILHTSADNTISQLKELGL